MLSDSPDVRAVSFVGSTPIAKYVYETRHCQWQARPGLGGAKNHMLVLPDADLDLAADAAVNFGLRLGRRAVHGDLCAARGRAGGRRPISKITDRMGKVVTGDGTRGGATWAPRHREHRDKGRRSYLDKGTEAGATLVVDGRDGDVDADGDGFFLADLFDNVTPGMPVYDDEIFGPVLGGPRRVLRRGA